MDTRTIKGVWDYGTSVRAQCIWLPCWHARAEGLPAFGIYGRDVPTQSNGIPATLRKSCLRFCARGGGCGHHARQELSANGSICMGIGGSIIEPFIESISACAWNLSTRWRSSADDGGHLRQGRIDKALKWTKEAASRALTRTRSLQRDRAHKDSDWESSSDDVHHQRILMRQNKKPARSCEEGNGRP